MEITVKIPIRRTVVRLSVEQQLSRDKNDLAEKMLKRQRLMDQIERERDRVIDGYTF